jgi:hypothetical protein
VAPPAAEPHGTFGDRARVSGIRCNTCDSGCDLRAKLRRYVPLVVVSLVSGVRGYLNSPLIVNVRHDCLTET